MLLSMNATDLNLLINQVCSQIVANGSTSNSIYSTVGLVAPTLIMAIVHFGYSIYKRHNPLPPPSENKPQV
jgi:hypothetical protein